MSFGGLSFALYMFRNTFILHNIDKLTDLVIHMLPMITMWNIHWNLRDSKEAQEWGFYDPNQFEFGYEFLKQVFYVWNVNYFAWAFLYYSILLVIRRKYIKENDLGTLYDYASGKNKMAMKIGKKYGYTARIAVFVICHYVYTFCVMLTTIPGFFIKEFAYIQVLFYCVLVLRNGADYMIYFTPSYQQKLKDLEKIEETAQKDSTDSTDSK
jgi:hypothetical protein